MQEKEELEMDHCEETEVHEELLRIVQEKLPKEEELYDLAELYKVFGDSTSGLSKDIREISSGTRRFIVANRL